MKKKQLLGYLMKRILFFSLILFTTQGCVTRWDAEIGQTRYEFGKANGRKIRKLILISNDGNNQVLETQGANPIFFYFSYDKLIRIDRGEQRPDIIIQNR